MNFFEFIMQLSNLVYLYGAYMYARVGKRMYTFIAVLFVLVFVASVEYHICFEPIYDALFGVSDSVLWQACRAEDNPSRMRLIFTNDVFWSTMTSIALWVTILPTDQQEMIMIPSVLIGGVWMFCAAGIMGVFNAPGLPPVTSDRIAYATGGYMIALYLIVFHRTMNFNFNKLKHFYETRYDTRWLMLGFGIAMFGIVVWLFLQPLIGWIYLLTHPFWHVCTVASAIIILKSKLHHVDSDKIRFSLFDE